MKAVNIVIGFVVFSIVLSMMFAATFDVMNDGGVEGADTFNQLSGQYKGYGEEFDKSDSTSRNIIGATEQGAADSETKDVNILVGALSGGRQVVNFFSNFDDIVHNATGEVNQGQSYIDPRITRGFLAVVMIILAFVVLHFIRGFKTET